MAEAGHPYSLFEPAATVKRLEAFFRCRSPEAAKVEVRDFQRLQGGYSRLTASFEVLIDGEARHYVVRGDPPAAGSTMVSDREKEWELLSCLTQEGTVDLPPARYFDRDGSELGTPAIISERIFGSGLSAASDRYTAEMLPGIALQMAELAASIHAIPVDRLPTSLPRPASWSDYIDGKIAEIRAIAASHAEPDPFYRYIAAWLDSHRPAPAPLCLVHGDFQSANVVYDLGGKVHAIDWEMAHIGDPREDLGWCKAVETFHIPDLVSLDEEGFCQRYREKTGLSEELVNPATLNYFLILSAAITLGPVMTSLTQLHTRESAEVRSASLISAIALAHRLFFDTIEELERKGLVAEGAGA